MKKYPFVILGIGILLVILFYLVNESSPYTAFLFIGGLWSTGFGLALINKKMSVLVGIIGLLGVILSYFTPGLYTQITGDSFQWGLGLLFIPIAIIGFLSYIIQVALSYK
jgi:hypothetical protein